MESKFAKQSLEKFIGIIYPVLKNERAEQTVMSLVERYGSAEGIFGADYGELCELVGENIATYIKVVSAVTSRRYTEKLAVGERYNRAEVAEYFKALFLGESVECVYAMLLDDDGGLIATKLINRGTVNSSDIVPRRILEVAIDLNSHRVILAHNHPHGLPKASEEDIRLTGCVSDVLALVGISLEYHLVIAGDECDVVGGG